MTSSCERHGVSSGGPGLNYLVGVDNKILPQQGQRDRRADLSQIVEVALKIRRVGQYADAGRTMLLIRTGDLDRVEIGPDHAFRRAGLLHFRDQADRTSAIKGSEKIANRRRSG